MKISTEKKETEMALYKTINKMAPSILTALIAAALGFFSLYYSPVPMIQDFGKMLTIGMIISFIVALFFLIPLLFVRDHFFPYHKVTHIKKNNKESWLERFLYRFTKRMVSIKWFIVVIAFIIAGFGMWFDTKVRVETDVETFMPQNTEELQDIHSLREIIGTTDQLSIVYQSNSSLDQTSIEWIDTMTRTLLDEYPDVIVQTKSITSLIRQMNTSEPQFENTNQLIESMPSDQLKLFLNEDGTNGVIQLGIKHLESEDLKDFINDLTLYLNDHTPTELQVTVTGKAVLDVEMISALTTGRYTLTLLGIGAVFIGLLIIYRDIKKAFIPLIPIILIVGWSGGTMYLFDLAYTPLTSTLGALIIGIGTEFTILIMNRHEEEKSTQASGELIPYTTSKIGKPILISALTTMGGFSALIISDFAILQNFGIMTLINISLALISTLVVMPAILAIFDSREKLIKQA